MPPGKKMYSTELKLEIVQKYLKGNVSLKTLGKEYHVNRSDIQKWRDAYLEHGVAGLCTTHGSYTGEFKIYVVEYMHKTGASIRSTAAHFNIPSYQTVSKWEHIYYEEGKEALYEERRGRTPKMKAANVKKTKIHKDPPDSNEDLIAELQRLRMENEYLKKLNALIQEREKSEKPKKVAVINELRQKYKLTALLKLAEMPRSTYYYYLKVAKNPDKYQQIKDEIRSIYHENYGRYGYRRITLELHNRGYKINHKTVQRLMKMLNLKCMVRIKKYRSYKGQVGKVAPNLIQRDFSAKKPNEKWTTDITEFALFGTKLYLSPILDMYNGEIVSYNISERPTLRQVMDMLDKAFDKIPDNTELIFHSDQGWQYQHKQYQKRLKDKGIHQSMSRKGNCLDNAVMENFFGLLKSELLYLREFSSMEEFKIELENYMDYYNNKRIKCKLKGLSPVQYRVQSSIAA